MSDELELTEEMKARLAKVGVSVEDYIDLRARVARSKFVLETIEPNLLTPEQVRDLQKREPETMVVDISGATFPVKNVTDFDTRLGFTAYAILIDELRRKLNI